MRSPPPSDADVFKQLPELSPHFHEIVWNGALVYQKNTSYGRSRAEVVCVDAFTGVVRAYVRRASFFFITFCACMCGSGSWTALSNISTYISTGQVPTYLPTSFGQMKPRVGKSPVCERGGEKSTVNE